MKADDAIVTNRGDGYDGCFFFDERTLEAKSTYNAIGGVGRDSVARLQADGEECRYEVGDH